MTSSESERELLARQLETSAADKQCNSSLMPEETPRENEPAGLPLLFWIIVIGALLSLAGGGTLFFLNQSGALGANTGGGPGLPSESYSREQGVDIWRNESWQPGTVEQVKERRYFVRYDRADLFPNEWLDASRLRARSP